jgi:hypothetical protein
MVMAMAAATTAVAAVATTTAVAADLEIGRPKQIG